MTNPSNPQPWLNFYPDGLAKAFHTPDQTIWEAVEKCAQKHADQAALSFEGETLSYAELLEAVDWLSEDLSIQGLENPRILMIASNSIDFVISMLAATRVGIVTIPSPALSAKELEAQWRDFDPNIILQVDEDAELNVDESLVLRAQYFVIAKRKETISGEILDSPDGEKAPIEPPPHDDLAIVQYTSGTTGSAKGAMMTHTNLVTNAQQNTNWFGWNASDVNVWMLPLCHTWGICCGILSSLTSGAHLVIQKPSRVNAEKTGQIFRTFGGSLLYASATFLYRLLDDPLLNKEDFSSLRIVKAGAMLTQGNLKERWDKLFPHAQLQQGYGLTEASPETHNNPPKRFKAGSVGVPIQMTDCRIVDAEDPSKILAPSERGEVAIKGPQVFAGYWRKPEASAKALRDGWLLTGDIGVMDEEGYLRIVDRKKDLLKFRGYSIVPATIESVLVEHPRVDEVIVVGRESEIDGEIPVACIVSEQGFEDADLEAFCRAHLARYEVPREFLAFDAIHKNHVGKPLRRKMREEVNATN